MPSPVSSSGQTRPGSKNIITELQESVKESQVDFTCPLKKLGHWAGDHILPFCGFHLLAPVFSRERARGDDHLNHCLSDHKVARVYAYNNQYSKIKLELFFLMSLEKSDC